MKRSPDRCVSCFSRRHLQLIAQHLRGEAPGLRGGVFGEVGSPAVLPELGPEPAHAAWPAAEESVGPARLSYAFVTR